MNAFKEAIRYTNAHRSNTLSIGTNITWGIFVFIMLLSLYHSLHHKVMSRFKGYNNHAMYCCTYTTDKYESRESASFDNALISSIPKNFKAIEHISPLKVAREKLSTYKSPTRHVPYFCIAPSCKEILKLPVRQGRFLSQHDQASGERVCVINERAKNRLFGLDNPIGQFIMSGQAGLKVIGVVDDSVLNLPAPIIYITDTLFAARYPHSTMARQFLFSIPTQAWADKKLRSKLEDYLRRNIHNVKDPTKLHVYFHDFTDAAQIRAYDTLFSILNAFVWILGSCFLINSIVNASNMLIVALRRRRQEIVIRKILGAKTKAIISLIFLHALFVTLIFSVVACILAFVTITLCNKYIVPMCKLPALIYPSNIVAITTLLLLIVSCLSSIVPIWKSFKIKPVEGLRQ